MKTLVINLDRSVERMEAIAGQLERLSMPYERIPAVDGKTLSFNSTLEYDSNLNKDLYTSRLI